MKRFYTFLALVLTLITLVTAILVFNLLKVKPTFIVLPTEIVAIKQESKNSIYKPENNKYILHAQIINDNLGVLECDREECLIKNLKLNGEVTNTFTIDNNAAADIINGFNREYIFSQINSKEFILFYLSDLSLVELKPNYTKTIYAWEESETSPGGLTCNNIAYLKEFNSIVFCKGLGVADKGSSIVGSLFTLNLDDYRVTQLNDNEDFIVVDFFIKKDSILMDTHLRQTTQSENFYSVRSYNITSQEAITVFSTPVLLWNKLYLSIDEKALGFFQNSDLKDQPSQAIDTVNYKSVDVNKLDFFNTISIKNEIDPNQVITVL